MRIQFVAVGLDILRNAQASSSERLCDSMVTPMHTTYLFLRTPLQHLHSQAPLKARR